MNLLKSSALDSIEFAVAVSRQVQPEAYSRTEEICNSLIGLAQQDRLRAAEHTPAPRQSSGASRPEKQRAERSRKSQGHCIRCTEEITLDPEKPLCADCYKKWAKYEDEDYAEKCCHACGKKTATSMRKPLCRTCYDAAA